MLIAVIPFSGLTVASAPGFAHYLHLLLPLERSDGFGAGVAEGLAPAIVLSVVVLTTVIGTERESGFLPS
jgi:hypothetical protein